MAEGPSKLLMDLMTKYEADMRAAQKRFIELAMLADEPERDIATGVMVSLCAELYRTAKAMNYVEKAIESLQHLHEIEKRRARGEEGR